MSALARIPLLFFFFATSIGVMLRWHFISPIDWITYPYFLHVHSHMMFLGWVLNVLCISWVETQIEEGKRKRYIILLWIIQLTVAGMTISFSLTGYEFFSIILSSLHTLLICIFSAWFFRDARNKPFALSRWFAKMALVFFMISMIGPFTLGPLMANGLAYTKWYYFAIYYYLHFQYNGTFTFGVLSLLFFVLQQHQISLNEVVIKKLGLLCFASVVLTYALSVLWASPSLLFNVIGLVGALLQLIGFIVLMWMITSPIKKNIAFPISIKWLIAISLFSLVLKLILQVLAAHPLIARMAYENRNYVIAYLHLVLLGMISSFLIGWMLHQKWIKAIHPLFLTGMLVGFVGMEVALIAKLNPETSSLLLFVFALLLWQGTTGLLLANLRRIVSRQIAPTTYT